MLRIYMDESGTHDGSPVVSVSAYAGRPKEWQKFIKDWNVAKRPIKIFHATDCEALRGEFDGWSADQRNELVARLLPVLNKYELRGNAIGINVNDFKAAVKNLTLEHLFGSPYAACFQVVVDNVLWQCREAKLTEALAFIHEDNDYKQEALDAFDFVKSIYPEFAARMTMTFASKEKMVPLQAADILAYEANKRLRDQSRPLRRSLMAIDPDSSKLHIAGIDKNNVDEMMRKLKITWSEIQIFGHPNFFLG